MRDTRLHAIVLSEALCLSEIEKLYLSHNPIQSIVPQGANTIADVRKLSKLRVLDISYASNAQANLADIRRSDGFYFNFDIDQYLPNYPKLR